MKLVPMHEEDSALWKTFLETNRVKKVDAKQKVVFFNQIDPLKLQLAKKKNEEVSQQYKDCIPNHLKHYNVDTVSSTYFKKTNLQGKLDLHGMTKDVAYRLLTQYFGQSQSMGKKNVLIITGKGNTSGTSVLKPLFLSWVKEHPHLVIAYSSAPDNLGGNGAFLVHIRKKRI